MCTGTTGCSGAQRDSKPSSSQRLASTVMSMEYSVGMQDNPTCIAVPPSHRVEQPWSPAPATHYNLAAIGGIPSPSKLALRQGFQATPGTATLIPTSQEEYVVEVLPGIHLVPGVRWSRVYLVEGDSLTLVDAGLPWSVGRVLGYIESIGRNVEDLSSILMTHSHPDHASGALAISRRTGAEIFAHGDDTRTHSDRVITLSYMRVFTSLKVPLPFLQRTPVSHLVVSDQVLPLLGGTRVIHTPGHTAGSVCYLLESRGVIFTGDTAFSDGERVSRSVALPRTRRSQLQGIAGQAGGPPVRHPLWRPWGACSSAALRTR